MNNPSSGAAKTAAAPAIDPSGIRLWGGRVMLGLFSLFMAMDAGMHVARPAFVIEATQKAGVDPSLLLPLGSLEILFLVLLWTSRFRILGAVLFTAFFGGAVAVHVIGHAAFFMPIIVAVVMWAGLVCLEPRAETLLGLGTTISS